MEIKLSRSLLVNFFILFLIQGAAAQSQQISYNSFYGKTIMTNIEYKSRPRVITTGPNGVSESTQTDAHAKIDKQTWFSVISNAKGQLKMTRELTRLEVMAPGPLGMEKYDSANTFESTDGAEAFVTSKLKALKKKVAYQLNGNQWKAEMVAIDDLEKVWSDNFPIIGKENAINGIFFNASLPKALVNRSSWKETITLSDSEVENTYTITEIDKSSITISLVSHQKFNNTSKVNLFSYGSIKGSPSQPMANRMGSIDVSKSYEGTIIIDVGTLLISKMDLTVTHQKNMINGNSTTPRTQTLSLQITNRF